MSMFRASAAIHTDPDLLCRRQHARQLLWLSGLLLFAGIALAAEPSSSDGAATGGDSTTAVSGDAIYRYCESCHGKRGAGGEGGKYPRIAGLPADYIDKQLHDFKSQRRVNKPMIPIFTHHRFDDTVINAVSTHIAEMSPPGLALWPYRPSPTAVDAYGSKQALAEAGAEQYRDACAGCHGDDGAGAAQGPPLIDQYPTYLRKQISDFAAGRREHAAAERCGAPNPAESEALIFHLVELGKD